MKHLLEILSQTSESLKKDGHKDISKRLVAFLTKMAIEDSEEQLENLHESTERLRSLRDSNDGQGRFKLKYTALPENSYSDPKALRDLNQKVMDVTEGYEIELWDVVDLDWSLEEARDLKGKLESIGLEISMERLDD